MQLNEYVTLGRSGLKVSPVCYGTMTFGNNRWGTADNAEAKKIFDRFAESGGNFVDTANAYAGGQSEEILGQFVNEGNLRDRMVIATKFTFNNSEGNANSGGNGRKNIHHALEGSLRRLKTDYIDLYWMHAWDLVTPVEEVVATLSSLVREGKILYYGFSDVPAWYAARAATLAECHSLEKPIALQLEYSLVERTIEQEHIVAAQHLGMAICPWSPLASGFLSGKYSRDRTTKEGSSRLEVLSGGTNPVFHKFSDQNWRVLEIVQDLAGQIGRSAAQVALNWLLRRPGVTSTIIGARTLSQLEDNLGALRFELSADAIDRLNAVSALDPAHPYMFFGPILQERINGGVSVKAWEPSRAI